MDLRDLPATLRRRWYFTALAALATVGVALTAFLAFPPTYEAKTSILLLPPKSTVGEGGNPYLLLADLGRAVDVVIRTLSSQSSVQAASALDPNGTYEVAPDYETNGPIFIITAGNKTPDSTLKTLRAVTDMVPSTLVQLQESLGIESQSQITSSVLATDDTPTTVRKSQIRAVIAGGALAAIFSILMVAFADSYLNRRARKRREKSDLTLEQAERPLVADSAASYGSQRLKPDQDHAVRRRIGLTTRSPSGNGTDGQATEAASRRIR